MKIRGYIVRTIETIKQYINIEHRTLEKKTLYFFIGQFLLTLSANCYFVFFFTVIYLAFGELRC